jgi:hypothetical protein
MKPKPIQEDWDILLKFLPEGWQQKASEYGALVRKRKINSAEILLRVLLIHLADGKSLRTTATYAQEAEICQINDVALLHRLKASERWLRWMSEQLVRKTQGFSLPDALLKQFRIRVVDASIISEPGATGSDWRLHYSLQLSNLGCDFFKITDASIGEGFQRFEPQPGDLFMGDRAYCRRNGLEHIRKNGAHALVRFHTTNVPLLTYRGKTLRVLEKLRSLGPGQIGDWDVWYKTPHGDNLVKGRLCAIRKSKKAIEQAKKKLRQKASRQQRRLRVETIEYAEYVIVFTSVNRHRFKSKDVMLLYRARWQIELLFKRLKSIIGLGHLPKRNEQSCMAWLTGKLFVALLVERIYHEAEFFSPWGYPLHSPS